MYHCTLTAQCAVGCSALITGLGHQVCKLLYLESIISVYDARVTSHHVRYFPNKEKKTTSPSSAPFAAYEYDAIIEFFISSLLLWEVQNYRTLLHIYFGQFVQHLTPKITLLVTSRSLHPPLHPFRTLIFSLQYDSKVTFHQIVIFGTVLTRYVRGGGREDRKFGRVFH